MNLILTLKTMFEGDKKQTSAQAIREITENPICSCGDRRNLHLEGSGSCLGWQDSFCPCELFEHSYK